MSGWPATNPSGLLPTPLPTFSADSILNSASLTGGPIAPGELISIFGTNLGPAAPIGPQLAGGKVTTNLAGVQVTFNGKAGGMILAYKTQLNVVVPFEVAGSAKVRIQVSIQQPGLRSCDGYRTASAAGIYTADSSGAGQAAALNADYSYNSASHPASGGSFVTLYMTGAGQTSPGCIDRFVAETAGELSGPALPVTAEIGGLSAPVLYAGTSVGIVSGVIQVDLLVPAGVSPGQQEVIVTIGSGASQTGVTIAVQ